MTGPGSPSARRGTPGPGSASARRGGSGPGFPWRGTAGGLLGFVALFGCGVLVAGLTVAAPTAPQPRATALPAPARTRSAAMPASTPTRIDIPAIKVHAAVDPMGVAADGAVQVPPLSKPFLTGWYRHGVTPGQAGNAVILGHVDSYKVGPAVFFYLGRLRAGDRVEVTRADRTVAVFRVYGVASFRKTAFPTDLVYGPNPHPELRLVTCGGVFDRTTRSYLSDIVVAASLVSWHKA